MADMTMRIEPSPELERMLQRVAQDAVDQVRTGARQEGGKGLYPVTIQGPAGTLYQMVEDSGESHWVRHEQIEMMSVGESGWRQTFTLKPGRPVR